MNSVRYTTGPVTGPVTFDLDADGTALLAEIAVDPDATTATAELTGSTETTHAARISMSGRTWTLALPRTRPAGPTVITADRRVSIISGAVTGSVCIIGGRILVDGIDVTAETVSGDITCYVIEPVTVDASSVSGDIDITATRGVRPDVRARSVSGHVRTH